MGGAGGEGEGKYVNRVRKNEITKKKNKYFKVMKHKFLKNYSSAISKRKKLTTNSR